MPIGQFGTRLQGGKIQLHTSPVTKTFSSSDEHVYEENQRIEPEWYCPVIPTVLAKWSRRNWNWIIFTLVPNYNPRELTPWYKGFIGEIVGSNNVGKFESRGIINAEDMCTTEVII
ncbi:DNA topoisomerase 2 [Meloidogyne graminicola]|uniref:DNA topoisomerase 2 n=1 Tax=Meloidogyne graminicola TaxID=189291 RepID=A0A8S9ZVV6_9BILA|nr:DNA topoisomerase 2 [Meloidogyne graminicola]